MIHQHLKKAVPGEARRRRCDDNVIVSMRSVGWEEFQSIALLLEATNTLANRNQIFSRPQGLVDYYRYPVVLPSLLIQVLDICII